jgi:D-alanyl-D-alanine carboxypeptidase/D-alanyl-D-alanine-endopeptidase (penicillin-binding protein 4)
MWMKQIKPWLGVLLAGVYGVAQAELPAPVNQALAQAQVPLDAVSVVVAEVGRSGVSVLSHRANELRNPASVMKLVTTLAGMELLGPAWRWRTPVYVEGSVRDGVLQGNLYIQGKGDPKLVSERIWLLLRRVQGLGIRQINGDVVLDRSAFEVAPVDPGEFDGEPLRPYNAAPDALLLNYKSVVMTWVPDAAGQQATLQVEPTLAGVNWPAGVPIREGACNDYRGGLKADFSDATQPRFTGRYPSKCGEKVWPLAYADPASYNARVIEGLWRASGGQLQGKVREGRVPVGLTPAFEWESPPLAEVVRDINKFSSNVMAQQLFLTLSLQQRGVGTYAASRDIVREWWMQRMGPGDEPRVANGSGLARDDRVSAQALARLLQYAWASPLMPELLNSLPLSGVDGTLRPERWRAGGSAHLKTGSLRDVNALAGIVDGAQGQRYVLVAVVNHPNANAVRPAMEALVDWVVKIKSGEVQVAEPSHAKTKNKPKDKKP